jgi:hypothetical protein
MKHSMIVASLLGVIALTGCSGIRVVQKTQTGGVVALQGAEGGAREKADEYMRQQCPKGYEIVEEGEAVVGQTTHADTRPGVFLGSHTTARSEDRREWRITYQCKGAADRTAETKTLVVYF